MLIVPQAYRTNTHNNIKKSIKSKNAQH
uniref:Uncharacterized protein n=1 Tax=Rhizophora mucronata TaxID=61149 RepID=A0A2P2N4D7_RHIMU